LHDDVTLQDGGGFKAFRMLGGVEFV